MASKRTILITGCSDGGLGSAVALEFHKAGWRVLATARNLSKLSETAAVGIESIQLDVNSPDSIKACVATVSELTGGSLDALFNNAGAACSLPVLDLDLDKVRDVFELNVFSIITVTKAFFPLLIKSGQGGLVVNHCSIASVMSMPFQGAYNASKAAAASLTQALRMELAPFGVKVVEVITGVVKSNFYQNAPPCTLPPGSIYAVAREPIEAFMSGQNQAPGDISESHVWAKQVVRDVSKANPSHQLWEGRMAFEVRLAGHLPVGLLDGMVKKRVGLDVLEQKIRDGGDPQSKKSV